MQLAVSLSAIVLYLICAAQIWRRFRARMAGDATGCGRNFAILWIAALILHGIALYTNIVTPHGLSLGITHAFSLVGWIVALMVLIALHSRPVEGLGLILLPFAALTIAAELVFPGQSILPHSGGIVLAIHVFISLLASSLFVIAALQAALLWYQDHRLRTHRPGGWLRALPPLQHTESILFQTIALGFILLTVGLITGMVFINQFFTMASPQRTLLFIASWVIFALLLLGRWRFGWRGRTAIRWTLTGFAILLIAYLSAEVLSVLA
ncbi:cytochrome C assembly family protein [Acidihalobacter ferrooxydans]|uniref:Cytochrome c assembly protein domain-containing protein n=1 Tax=Acidihalobacter ferrooxydans TaxID=1765967 RepID=A0A1P8UJB9_9GAMM|nr:cytochrome c biogenesis protein CcsA [Acidihalobacter ferrooxydans]APZ43890.1 hypothetical protein BW247_12975 [Acidihalobacter ferrooxydans]